MYHAPMERGSRRFARAAVALVWLYNGAWCKLLRRCPGHVTIVSAAFGEGGLATAALMGLGAVETGLAIWVLSRRSPRLAALVQTVLLVAMNAAGLTFGRDAIADPGELIVGNLAFLALVWVVALEPAPPDDRT
jgi:hypothetical protein